MPSFDFVKMIVTIFVFVFFLAIIVIYVIKLWGGKEGFEVIDYPTQNAQNISEMIDTVNIQLDKMRTLKTPVPKTFQKIIYMPNLESDMQIYGNLLNIINNGVVKINQDLINLGKIGNPSLMNLKNELTKIKSKIPEFIKVCNTHVTDEFANYNNGIESFATKITTTAPTTMPVSNSSDEISLEEETTSLEEEEETIPSGTVTSKETIPSKETTPSPTKSPNLICLQQKESEYIQRLMKIVEYHNEIIQKILGGNNPKDE